MTRQEELLELIADQEQLRAMQESCRAFSDSLDKKLYKFMEKHLGFKEGEKCSVVEIIAKALEQ